MSAEQLSPTDSWMAPAITEVQERIVARYPTAIFAVEAGEDSQGLHLTDVVDRDDPDDVVDVVIDRLLERENTEGLPRYVVPARMPERVAAMLRRHTPSVHHLPSHRCLPLQSGDQ